MFRRWLFWLWLWAFVVTFPLLVHAQYAGQYPSGQGPLGTGNSGYPSGATPVTQTGSNGTGSASSASLPAVSGQFTYLCGFTVTNNGATTPIDTVVTAGQFVGSGANFQYNMAVAAVGTNTSLTVNFSPCVRPATTNVGVTVSAPAPGSGNTNNTVNVWGYTQ